MLPTPLGVGDPTRTPGRGLLKKREPHSERAKRSMTFILSRAAAFGFAVVHNIEELRQPIEVIRVFRLF